MVLRLYSIRLEERTIIELERRAGDHPVAPLVRKIIDGWLELDENDQKEAILKEIEKLEGHSNLLNQQLKNIISIEQRFKIDSATEESRKEYLKNNPTILEMFKVDTISSHGYKKLMVDLRFKNREQVIEWLKSVE